MKNKPKPTTAADLLGTKNAVEQAARIQQLMGPVIDLVIRHDGRTGQTSITVIGGQLSFADCYGVLDAARRAVQQQETAAMAAVKEGECS